MNKIGLMAAERKTILRTTASASPSPDWCRTSPRPCSLSSLRISKAWKTMTMTRQRSGKSTVSPHPGRPNYHPPSRGGSQLLCQPTAPFPHPPPSVPTSPAPLKTSSPTTSTDRKKTAKRRKRIADGNRKRKNERLTASILLNQTRYTGRSQKIRHHSSLISSPRSCIA